MKSLLVILLLVGTIFITFPQRFSNGATNNTITLNASTCASLVNGQNATETFVASTCTINASNLKSPFFLTNVTTTLIIPSPLFLTLNSGFGFANYGVLNITGGTLLQKVPLINYGIIQNFHTWNVQNTFVQMNTTGASVLTSGFTTNQPSGTITISSTGFMYNGNRVINNGAISNSGKICNHITGLSVNGTVTGNAVTGNSISANC